MYRADIDPRRTARVQVKCGGKQIGCDQLAAMLATIHPLMGQNFPSSDHHLGRRPALMVGPGCTFEAIFCA